MTTLRDPFANVHKKDIKNKKGEVVAQVDYVGWSQSADRLDDVGEAWSFSIIGIGDDWVHGRLTIGDRHFENIGYAENAEAEWKKEVLKDAASDAFKRCAALAGVARYLYDKDAPRSNGHRPAPSRPAPTPIRPLPERSSTAMPEMPEFPDDFGAQPPVQLTNAPLPPREPFQAIGAPQPKPLEACPDHPGEVWRGEVGDLYHKMPNGQGGYCRPEGQPKKAKAR